jgi:outer membrane biosynthesis protein TonB
MSQKLGGNFERRGLKLFKRRAGKLFVCRVKPKAVDSGLVFSARVTKILEVLKGKSGIMLHDLVEAICPSPPAEAPAEGETPVKTAPTDEQITVIKDIRWLANEGYVIEYSDGMVFLGVQGEPQTPKAAAPAAPSGSEAPIVEEEASETVEAAPAAETAVEPSASETAPEQATTPAITTEEAPVTESESVIAESSLPVADEAPASTPEEATPESAAASSEGETASA